MQVESGRKSILRSLRSELEKGLQVGCRNNIESGEKNVCRDRFGSQKESRERCVGEGESRVDVVVCYQGAKTTGCACPFCEYR